MLKYTFLKCLILLAIDNLSVHTSDSITSYRFEKVFNPESKDKPFTWMKDILRSSQQENLKYICEEDVHPYKIVPKNLEEYKVSHEYLYLAPESVNIKVEMIKCKFGGGDGTMYATASLVENNASLTRVMSTFGGYILIPSYTAGYLSSQTDAERFVNNFKATSMEYVEWGSKHDMKNGFNALCLSRGHNGVVSTNYETFKFDSKNSVAELLVLHCADFNNGVSKSFYYVGLTEENGVTTLLPVDKHRNTNNWYFLGDNLLDALRKSHATKDPTITKVKSIATQLSNNTQLPADERRYHWGKNSKTLLDAYLRWVCNQSKGLTSIDDIWSVKIIKGFLLLMPYGYDRNAEVMECQFKQLNGDIGVAHLIPITLAHEEHQKFQELKKTDEGFVFSSDLEGETLRHKLNSEFAARYAGTGKNGIVTWTDKNPPTAVLNRLCLTSSNSEDSTFTTVSSQLIYTYEERKVGTLLLDAVNEKKLDIEILVCASIKNGNTRSTEFNGVVNPYEPRYLAPVVKNYNGFYEFDSVREFTKKLLIERFIQISEKNKYIDDGGNLIWIAHNEIYGNLIMRCGENRPQGIVKRVLIHEGLFQFHPLDEVAYKMEICKCEFHNSDFDYEAIVGEYILNQLHEVLRGPKSTYVLAVPNITVDDVFNFFEKMIMPSPGIIMN